MRPCKICGTAFQGNGTRHWFCSKACKAVAHYEMKSAITVAEYAALLVRQDGRCAICGSTSPGGPKSHDRFYADHCHATGRPRGLLCLRCNVALGSFDDDPERLRRAASYIENGS